MQLGYTFGVTRYLSLRPYIGIASIVIDGGLHVDYEFTIPSGLHEIAKTHGESFSWSVGPKLGLDFTAHATSNIGLYCGVNFTQQSAQISMKTEQTSEHPADGTVVVLQKGHLSQTRSVPLFGFEIGPVWDQWFCNQRYHIQLRPVWQSSTLGGGNLSFLNSNNIDIGVGAELRGINIRALFEF